MSTRDMSISNPSATSMELRDYFAGLAMQAVVIPGDMANLDIVPQNAVFAYAMADAMLKARQR